MTGNTAQHGYIRFLSLSVLVGGLLSRVLHVISAVFVGEYSDSRRFKIPSRSTSFNLLPTCSDAHGDAHSANYLTITSPPSPTEGSEKAGA